MRERVIARAIAILAMGGCFMIQGRAEMVKRGKEGGVLALKGDRGYRITYECQSADKSSATAGGENKL